MTTDDFTDRPTCDARRLPVEIDAASERADIILDRPPLNVIAMPQRDQLRRGVRGARRRRARARDRAARDRRAFFQRRQHQGLPRSVARARLEARLEHRRAGALLEAGDRRQSRLLLRRRVRTVARLRFPHRVGDLPLCAAGAEARADPRLGRLGAAAEDGRHRPHQGHRDALAPHTGASRPTSGASSPNAWPMPSSKPRPTRSSRSCATFSPLAQRTAKKLLNDTEERDAVDRDRTRRALLQPAAQSDDFREGVEAFHAKRPAKFKGT